MDAAIVVVGSGMAGWTVIRELRKLDPQVPIVLMTKDSGDFYAKPSLSNAFAQRRTPDQLVTTPATDFAKKLDVQLRPYTSVSSIGPASKELVTNDGPVRYNKLVLAMGAQPIQVGMAGDACDQVISVNSLDDYRALHRHLAVASAGRQAEVLIVGAGLIGCEFANDLVAGGYSVRVVDLSAYPLASLLPKDAGQAMRDALETQGVRWNFGATVTAVNWNAGGDCASRYDVVLTDGTRVGADVVVSAVGLRPNCTLAKEAGLACERGILADSYLRTSHEDIFAVGDCVQYATGAWHAEGAAAISGGMCLPYVMPIMAAARALAATLAGKDTAVVFPVMPIIVKTPALPVVITFPASGVTGSWRQDEPGVWRFHCEEDRCRGFLLTGKQVSRRTEMVAAVAF